MNEPRLLDQTLALYRERVAHGGTAEQIAREAGVNIHWLRKTTQGRLRNPGVNTVEQLHNWLQATRNN